MKNRKRNEIPLFEGSPVMYWMIGAMISIFGWVLGIVPNVNPVASMLALPIILGGLAVWAAWIEWRA